MLPFFMPFTPDQDEVVLSNREPAMRFADTCRMFCMVSTPGGRIFTGGSNTGSISIWDTNSGAKEGVLHGHEDCVIALAYCEGIIYSASADSTARAWNPAPKLTGPAEPSFTQKQKMLFKGHKALVAALWAQHSNNGTGLLTGSDDETIKQWNTETGVCVHTFKGHDAAINVIICSETHMYSASADGKILIWDLFSRKKQRTLQAHSEGIWTMTLLPDGRLITAGGDALIKVWNQPMESDEIKITLSGEHRGKIRRVHIQGPILFSAGADNVINVWNLNSGRIIEKLKGHSDQITSLTMQNNRLISCGFDMEICRWDVEDILPVKQPVVPLRPLGELVVEIEKREVEQKVETVEHDPVAKAKKMMGRPIEEILDTYNEIPARFLVKSLKFKVETSTLMGELTLFVPFLVSFIMFFLLTRPIEDIFYMTKALDDVLTNPKLPDLQVDENYLTINDPSSWEKWMTGVVIPATFLNRAVSGALPNVLRGQNYLIGALRIRTIRAHKHSCVVNELILPNWTKCYGDATAPKNVDKEDYACSAGQCEPNEETLEKVLGVRRTGFNYSATEGEAYWGRHGTYPAGGYTITIPFTLSLDEAREKAKALVANGFVDRVSTRFIAVDLITYNAYIDTFCHSKYVTEVTQEGAWIPYVQKDVFAMASGNLGPLIYEVYFMTFVMYYIFRFFFDMIREIRRRRFLAFIFDFWNLLELGNMGIFYVMYGYRMAWYTVSFETKFKIPNEITTYPTQLEQLGGSFVVQVWLNSVNTILTFLKLLKFVRLNDRLNILTRTLAGCQQALAGILSIFLYIVCAFALCANALYGNNLFAFRSLDQSFSYLMRQLLGDFDYDAMFTENESMTFLFFWSFQVLALFILLNFLIAVISESFEQVSEQKSHVPLDAAILKTFHDLHYSCLPATIKRQIKLMMHRRTQTGIVEMMMNKVYVRATTEEARTLYGDVYYDEASESVPATTIVTRNEFLDLLPKADRKLAERKFLVEIWRDTAWEFHHQLMDEGNLQNHQKEEAMHDAVHKGLIPLLHAMPLFDTYLSRIVKMTEKIKGGEGGEDLLNSKDSLNMTTGKEGFTAVQDVVAEVPEFSAVPWAVSSFEAQED